MLASVPPDAVAGRPPGGGQRRWHPLAAANALYLALKAHDVHVRWFAEPRLADRLRISVGTREENDRLLAVLTDLLSPPDYGARPERSPRIDQADA